MCGLVGVFSKKGKNTGQRVYEIYKKQEKRGKEGYGFITIDKEMRPRVYRGLSEGHIKKDLVKSKEPIILFHHRKPTSTRNTLGTTHPIFVSHEELQYDYYVAHNGVLTNHRSLKLGHEKLGYSYRTEFHERTEAVYKDGRTEKLADGMSTFNDSEALAIEMARYLDGKTKKVEMYGSFAVWGIQIDKETGRVKHIFFTRNNGRELGTDKSKKWVTIASEHGTLIAENKLYKITPDTRKEIVEDIELNEYTDYNNRYKNGTKPSKGTVNTSANYGDRLLPIPATKTPDPLVNAYYTYSQMHASGHPTSAFESTYLTRETNTVKSTVLAYYPKIYTGKDCVDRPTLDEYHEQRAEQNPVEKEPTKEELMLLEYAEKIAGYQAKMSLLEDSIADGAIDQSTYDIKTTTIEAEVQLLMEKMVALGFDADEIDQAILDAEVELDYKTSIGYTNNDIAF